MTHTVSKPSEPKRFAVVTVAPPSYPHWQAFSEISDCVHFGLVQLGFDSSQRINSFASDRINIVLGGNLLSVDQQLPPHSVIFNLEQICMGSPWLSDSYISILRRYRVWDYSQKNIDTLKQLGINDVALVPLGYVRQLSRIAPQERDIDVLFYGSIGERRERILRRLKALGVNLHVVFGLYGEQRDRLIARSKIVLNVHYYDSRLFEIVRIGYLLANRAFVVSEESADEETEMEFKDGMVIVPYRHLVKTCMKYLGDDSSRTSIAEQGFKLFSSRDQARFLLPVVSQM